MYFARYDPLGLNLHATSGEDDAIKPTRDDHAIAFNLSFDFRVLTQDHCLFGDDVALDVSVNAKRSGECQRAFERHALINETGPLFTATILRRAWPLPSHR